MNFKRYQHIEKFGNTEVENIEIGRCYVFPKVDGSNASCWYNDSGDEPHRFCAGSRNRELTLEKDNAGFFNWVIKQENIKNFLRNNPNLRLYGEWLVPHSLKTYRDDAWRRFYVFDVMDSNGILLSYDQYKPLMDEYNIDYIPPIKIITNGSYEDFVYQMNNNIFLIEDGKGVGEGVVIKNYSFVNKYGRTIWAKIVTSEFKEKHHKEMGAPEVEKKMTEDEIVKEFVTKALCEKVYAKIKNETGDWKSQYIPRLLNTVYYDLVREEIWEMIKKFNKPTINFKTLQHFTFNKVKEHLPQIF